MARTDAAQRAEAAAMAVSTLLDDLAVLVETHGADEIVLHRKPVDGAWECVWGKEDDRWGWANDASLTTAVRAMRTRADEIQRSLDELEESQAAQRARAAGKRQHTLHLDDDGQVVSGAPDFEGDDGR